MSETNFGRLEPEETLVKETVFLGKSMNLDVDEGDMNDLIAEMTIEKLNKVQMQQHMEILQTRKRYKKVISASAISELFGKSEKPSNFIQKKNSKNVAQGIATALVNDTDLTHFRNTLNVRTK